MSSQTSTERKVGIFVFLGLLITCALIIHFGKVGDRFRGGYPITVEFSNAGGLVRGGQVLYSGVLVGKIASVKLKHEGSGVLVKLNLYNGVEVRNNARFLIKQSGLLGDQNIVIVAGSNTTPLLKAGDVVRGSDPFDFSDAATQAGDAIRKLNMAINKFSDEILEGKTVDDLKRGIKNFADLSNKLQSNSDRLNVILDNARKGQGTIGKLLTDDQLFEELKRLVHNWRVHGLLYREKSDERYPSPRKGAVAGPSPEQ